MAEHSKLTLEQIAKNQFQETGRIDHQILDHIRDSWNIDLSSYHDIEQATELWRNIITIYLVDRESYREFCYRLANTARGVDPGDLPDIVA